MHFLADAPIIYLFQIHKTIIQTIMITSPLRIVVTSILITLTGLFFSACSKDDDASNNNDDDTPQLGYVVTNVGNGGVTSINDGDDLENLFIVDFHV